jgi:hypothetical protein
MLLFDVSKVNSFKKSEQVSTAMRVQMKGLL